MGLGMMAWGKKMNTPRRPEHQITPEQAAKVGMSVLRIQGQVRTARSLAYPFDYYHSRGILTDDQHRSGLRYAALWQRAKGASGYRQVSYEVSTGGGILEPWLPFITNSAFMLAHQAIDGRRARDIAFEVCCDGQKATKERMTYLRDAMDDLSNHF